MVNVSFGADHGTGPPAITLAGPSRAAFRATSRPERSRGAPLDRVDRDRALPSAGPRLVRRPLRGPHRGPAWGLAGHRRGPGHAGRGADGLRQFCVRQALLIEPRNRQTEPAWFPYTTRRAHQIDRLIGLLFGWR